MRHPFAALARRVAPGLVVPLVALALAAAAPAAARTLDASRFPSLAVALDSARAGDRVYVPAGLYVAPPEGWTLRRAIELFGDGIGTPGEDDGTCFRPDLSDAPEHRGHTVFRIAPGIANLYLHDFKIRVAKPPTGPGAESAIDCETTAGGPKVSQVHLERILVLNHGGDGFHFDAFDGADHAIVDLGFTDCYAVGCGNDGFHLRNTFLTRLVGGSAGGNRKKALFADSAPGIRVIGFGAERDEWGGTDPILDSQVRISASPAFTILGCHFEDFDRNPSARTALTIDHCSSGSVDNCLFVNRSPGDVAGSRGILVFARSSGIAIGGNDWAFVDTLVRVNTPDGTAGCTVQPQSLRESDVHTHGLVVVPDAPAPAASTPRFAHFAAPIVTAARGTGAHARIDREALAAAVANDTLVTGLAEGVYRVAGVLTVTAPANAAGGAWSLALAWPDGGVAGAGTLVDPLAADRPGTASGALVVHVGEGGTITWRTSATGATAGSRCSVHLRLEPL